RTVLRRSALITALLVGLVLVEGVHMALRHLDKRHDFSQDQLFTVSDGTRAILAKLEDRLQIKAFVTQEVRSGEMSLLKARVEAQIKDFQRLAGGRMGLVVQDPSILSAAAEEAHSFGIEPLPVVTTRGGEQNRQLVYLGAVLRYRSRTEVIPLINPWSFEADFAGAVQRLLRDQRLRVGWLGEPVDQDSLPWQFGTFRLLRARLEARMEVVDLSVPALEAGARLPDNLDVLLVLRPSDWHPRAVFALDQFIAGGGHALICMDLVRSSPFGDAAHVAQGKALEPSGLEALLQSWGTPLVPGHVWDSQWPGDRGWVVMDRDANGQATERGRLEPIRDPACPALHAEGFERTFPPTARLDSVQFFWTHAFGQGTVPNGLHRFDVLRSSPGSYVVDPVLKSVGDLEMIEGQTRSLLASGSGQAMVLATVLSGSFPSAFTKGAPTPFDATLGDRHAKVGITDEPVRAHGEPSQVVLVGDCDWLRDPPPRDLGPVMPSASAANLTLLDNLVDWLSQEEDLIAVRSKEPRERPLHNFLEAERNSEGLLATDLPRTQEEMRDRLARQDQAEARARRARWSVMAWPLLGCLALVFLIAGLWNWKERTRP
ncbi:MAG TPA: Gldg family protein, partial [Planctomycetota bacterium]|nr:Gldg family protein [Planctomycetota bacterium]